MAHTWEDTFLIRANNGFGGKTVSTMRCTNLYAHEDGSWTGDVEEDNGAGG
ncbi:MAG TPA: hypothetical protein VGK90_03935 [Rhizomicrobium sp.]|jgi:hypothetical protein